MGLVDLGFNPLGTVINLLTSPQESMRREEFARRARLYRDDYTADLEDLISRIYQEEAVRLKMYRLAQLTGANSFLKRISDELARPIYAVPPIRRVVNANGEIDEESTEAYAALCVEMNLNEQMDLTARLLPGSNHAFLFPRYIDGLGMCLDVITPDTTYVISDPRKPTYAASIGYDRGVVNDSGECATEYVFWDDKMRFSVDCNGIPTGEMQAHDFGRIPIVDVSRRGRWGSYWDYTTGNDLVACSFQSALLNLLALKNHKSQSHLQLAYIGETADGFAKDQTLDEESVLTAVGNGNLQAINLQGDPAALLRTKEAIETATAANYGISRDRLNQKSDQSGSDIGLQERTAELMQVMRRAELQLFEVVKSVSREHPEYQIDPDARLELDYGQLHNRVDRKTQLEVRQTERSMGLRSGIDDVIEDNPELQGNREQAKAYIKMRMVEEGLIVQERRALNIADDASSDMPGQNPTQNGELGPLVRDGKLSKDAARKISETGDSRAMQIARSVLQ